MEESDLNNELVGVDEKEKMVGEPVEKIIEPHLKLIDGIVVIFGLMVGSGIFSSSGLVYADVGSAGMSLTVWLLTGALALTGALCYAELGTMIPGSGGEAPYLERGFGPWATFTFNWASCFLLKPGSTAIIAVAFAKYTIMTWYGGRMMSGEEQEALLAKLKWPVKAISTGCVLGTAVLSALSKNINRRSQLLLTIVKLLSLALVIIAGLVAFIKDPTKGQENLGRPFSGTTWSLAAYASAINHGLWAYEGWNNLNLVAGDLKRPTRNLPMSIWIAVVMVIGLYLLTLTGYFLALPASIIASSETIGVEFGRAVMGTAGAYIMPVLIAICIFGACLSGMSTSAEVVIFAGNIGHMPALLAHINPTLGTAIYAYILQAVLSIALVLLSDFDGLVHIYTFPAWIFYGGSVLALLVLRGRKPDLTRPYRVWITTPILFLVSCLLLMVSSFWAHPIPIGISCAGLLVSLPVYYLFIRDSSRFKAWLERRQLGKQEMAEA